jgi:hypothetical protein
VIRIAISRSVRSDLARRPLSSRDAASSLINRAVEIAIEAW